MGTYSKDAGLPWMLVWDEMFSPKIAIMSSHALAMAHATDLCRDKDRRVYVFRGEDKHAEFCMKDGKQEVTIVLDIDSPSPLDCYERMDNMVKSLEVEPPEDI